MADDLTPEQRWAAAISEIEVLEPWLTESGQDDHYWDDVAARTVELIGPPTVLAPTAALRQALSEAFPGTEIRSDNGLYRDRVDDRIERIAGMATK